MTRSDPLTAAVIYNPIKTDLAALKSALEAEPKSHGWKVIWLPTAEDDPGQGPAREALAAGASLIVAAGGDGTVRAIAEVVSGSDAALALLPSGTGNLLARNLSLTLDDPADALKTAFTGTDRKIDVGSIEIRRADQSVDKHVFLVMAGAGLDAKTMSNTDDDLKKKVGWLAYGKAFFTALREEDGLRLDYKIDAQRNHSGRVEAIIIGNCGSLPAKIVLLPDAKIDDGLLDVIVLKPESIGGWIAVAVKIFWENGIVKRTSLGRRMSSMRTDSVRVRRGRSLVMRLSRPEEVQLDGDPFGEMTGCRITVGAGALTIKTARA